VIIVIIQIITPEICIDLMGVKSEYFKIVRKVRFKNNISQESDVTDTDLRSK